MKIKYKTVLLISIIVFMLALQGCSFVGLSDDELLQPPKSTGVKAEILNLLEETTGGGYKLKYPQTGDNCSAIIMHDIGGESSEEAIAFYTTKKEINAPLNVMFMENVNGKWKTVGIFSNAFTEIDRVCFGDFDADGNSEVIVGWTSYLTNTNQITMYKYSNNSVSETLVNGDSPYTDMLLMDITNDNVDDLVVLTSTTDEETGKVNSFARLYSSCFDGNFSKISETAITADVISYSQILCGNVANGVKGVFLDGYTSGQSELVTDVIYYSADKVRLVCPLSHKTNVENYEELKTNITARNTSTVCKDVDDDGIIEVPAPYTPVVSNKDFVVSTINQWYKVDVENGGELKESVQTIASYSDGYYFILPDKWCNNVAASNDNSARTMSIYRIRETVTEESTELSTEQSTENSTIPTIVVDEDENKQEYQKVFLADEEPLITIKTFSEKVWENEKETREAEGYIVIKKNSNLVYAYKIEEHSKDLEYTLTYEQVNNSFKLLT